MSTTSRVLALVGAGLFEASRRAARRPIEPSEEVVFRAANGAGDRLRVPVRAVMQAGTFVTVPTVALLLGMTGHRRLATQVAIGGTAAWLLAKAAKPLGGRSRPEGVLEDVTKREHIAGDLGWVSGHTAVSTTLAATIASVYPRATVPLAAVVATTAFGRMYVGAHLPLDLVGGAGLGLVIAGAVIELRPA
jgi:membrane-associated phospholipid phosphatase